MRNKGFISLGITILLSALVVGGALVASKLINNKVNQNLGADSTLLISGTVYTLSGSGVSAAATSIGLVSLTIPQTSREIADSDLSSTFYITLEPGSRTRQEVVSCTTVTQSGSNDTATLSGCSRGLLPFSPYTASSTYAFAHGGGTSLVFSNPPQVYEEFAAKGNNETITGQWTFTTFPITASSSLASETVSGDVELATGAEAAAGTASGTQTRLVLPTAISSSTPSSRNMVPITGSDGKLAQGFLDLTEDFTFAGTSTFTGVVSGIIPVGVVLPYATTTPPTGWLLANGQSVATTTYSDLFAIIGYSYGGSTSTFALPNLKGRDIIGFGSATTTIDEMGEIGGEITHTQTIAEMPAHTHTTLQSTAESGSAGTGDNMSVSPIIPLADTGSTGSGTAFNVMDPYIILNYIIKF